MSEIIISSGVTSTGMIVSGASMRVWSGGYVGETLIDSLGRMSVSSGGMASNTFVKNGGSMFVSYSGTADGVTVSAGGVLEVGSGGTATNIDWTPCVGDVLFSDAAYLTFTSDYSGVYYNQYEPSHTYSRTNLEIYDCMAYVFRDGMVGSTAVRGYYGSLMIFSGGVASKTVVDSYGSMSVFSSGVANSTTVLDNGELSIFSGGMANDTVVGSSGTLYVRNGGTVNGTTLSAMDGHAYLESGATMNGTTIDHAYLRASNGATMNSTILKSGAYFEIDKGGVANGITVEGGATVYVSSGGTAANIDWTPGVGNVVVLNGAHVTFTSSYSGVYYVSGGTLVSHTDSLCDVDVLNEDGCVYAFSGGFVDNATIANRGNMYVSSGASVVGTTIRNYGSMALSSCGVANSTTLLDGGGLSILSGGTADGVTVSAGGFLNVRSGGTATNIGWTPCVGDVTFSDGAHVTFTSDYSGVYYGSGNILLGNSSYLSYNYFSGAYRLHVFSGGIIYEPSIVSGRVCVYSGGSACNTDVESGSMFVYSGGFASDTDIEHGSMFVYSGGFAKDVSIDDGRLYVSGGSVYGARISSAWTSMYIGNGGWANSSVIGSLCTLEVSSGGIAGNTFLKSGSVLYVRSGAVVSDTVVSLGAYAYIAGTVCGSLQIENGALVSAYSGAEIIFNLENRAPGNQSFINDWRSIQDSGKVNCFITVSGDQEYGTYRLADDVGGFYGTITVKAGGVDVGVLSVGNQVNGNGKSYILEKTLDDGLQVVITPFVDSDDVYVTTTLVGKNVKRNAYVAGADVMFINDLIGTVSGGTIYGSAGFADVPSRQIGISGCTAKRFYSVGNFAEGVTQSGEEREIVQSTISGSTFTGGLFLGANAVDSTINTDVWLIASDVVSKLIMGGSNIGKQAAGNSFAVNNLTVTGDVGMNLTDCVATNFCCGGSLLANECQENRTGGTMITIAGGTYDAIAGGSLFQSKATNNMYSIINGNSFISISGDASIRTLYGGSTAVYVGPTRKETINGDIGIYLDVASGVQVTGSIYVGGAGFCTVNGTGVLDITGSGMYMDGDVRKPGDVLATKNLVGASAYAAGDDRRIGDTKLNFNSFCGTVKSMITFFTDIYINSISSVNFTNYKSDFACKDWMIEGFYDLSEASVILSGNDQSKGQIHNIDFNNSNLLLLRQLEEGEEWTIFKVLDDDRDLQTLCNFSDAQSFLLNGEEIDWDDDELCGISENETYKIEYRFDEDEHCGMLVASLFS